MTKKLEGRSGRFSVWHLGKLAFAVENEKCQVLANFTNLSDAFKHARWLHQTNAAFISRPEWSHEHDWADAE